MTELPSEIERARRLLRGVTPSAGARDRIYATIVTPPSRARHRLLSPALAAAAVLVASGAAAVSLGVVYLPAVFRPAQTVPEPRSLTHKPERAVGRADRHRSHPQPATPIAPMNSALAPSATLAEPAEPDLRSRPTPARSGGDASASHKAEATPPSSELALQVKAYRRAVALIPDDPSRALGELRAFRRQWPESTLSPEVDLRIIQTLLALRNSAEAGREAEAFLAHHPGSPRTAEMQGLVRAERRADAGSN
jgi:hypothetical protein